MSLGNVLSLLGAVFLILLFNGLFVAAEYAFVSMRRSRIKELVDDGHTGARLVQHLQENLERSVAGTQLGVTLASLGVGWIGENSIHEAAKLLFSYIPALAHINPPAGLGFALSYLVLSMLHVTIGEQVPKTIALRLTERTALFLAWPFKLFCLITSPLLWVMNGLAGIIISLLVLLGLPRAATSEERMVRSAEELEILIDASAKAGKLEELETDLLKRALDLKDLTVRDVMVPRMRMDCIPDSLSLTDLLSVICKTKHSKLPVYKDNDDNVVGILNTRDLFDVFKPNPAGADQLSVPKDFQISSIMRDVYLVPESKKAGLLLEEMRARKLQMAVILDEHGGTAGLVTLEDLVEQLVGEIYDEYDKPQEAVTELEEGRWQVSGELTLFEVNKTIGSNFTCAACTTIAGAVVESLGRLPGEGDSLELSGYQIKVLAMTNRVISSLEIARIAPTPPEPAVKA